jgi:hypothetical protein
VSRLRRGHALRGFDQLDDRAVVGRLVGIACRKALAHGADQAHDGLRPRHGRVELFGIGHLADQRLRILAQGMPLGGLRPHVRNHLEPLFAQRRDQRAAHGSGGSSDEDGGHARTVHRRDLVI